MSNTMHTTTTTPAPAPAQGSKMQRAIAMSFFREGRGAFANGKTRELKDDIVALSARMNDAGEDGDKATIRVGLLVGQMIGSKSKKNTEKDGTERVTTMLLGSFRGTRFSDQGTQTANGVYLPSLFVDHAVAALAANGGLPVEFAIELGVERDPRPGALMPYNWTVHNLLADLPGAVNPLDRIAAMIGKHDLVKLPAASPVVAIAHDPETGEIDYAENGEAVHSATDAAEAEEKVVKAKNRAKAA